MIDIILATSPVIIISLLVMVVGTIFSKFFNLTKRIVAFMWIAWFFATLGWFLMNPVSKPFHSPVRSEFIAPEEANAEVKDVLRKPTLDEKAREERLDQKLNAIQQAQEVLNK